MMGSLQLLNALATKPESEPAGKELMYVDEQLNGKAIKAMVDTGASHNFVSENEAKRLGLTWKKRERCVKAVNGKAQPLTGYAQGVDLRLGMWKGQLDFSVIPMDDYGFVIGLDFMRQAGAVPLPILNAMAIFEKGAACIVPTTSVKGTKVDDMQRISAMHLVNHPTEKKERKNVQGGSSGGHIDHGRVKGNKVNYPSIRSRRIKKKTWTNNGARKNTHDDEDVAEMGGGECHDLIFRRIMGRDNEVLVGGLIHF